MNQLYEHINITKQAHLSFQSHQELLQQEIIILLSAIADLREMHPEMGARKMYHIIKPDIIGRDKFILLSIENGFGVHKQRSFQRTTYNSHIYKYKNLIDGAVLFDINNIWVSDITYFRVQQVYFYLTFILDLYSRRIIGSIAYPTLEANANILALNMALKTRDVLHYDNLIHHSDRGTQYTSTAYTDLLLKKNISISMCDSVYHNVHAERVNGIIKNEYLKHWTINSFSSLKICLKKAVSLYNYERPHMALNYMTPIEYEAHINNISISDHVGLHLYSSIKP
jgi:hypothetical protein